MPRSLIGDYTNVIILQGFITYSWSKISQAETYKNKIKYKGSIRAIAVAPLEHTCM